MSNHHGEPTKSQVVGHKEPETSEMEKKKLSRSVLLPLTLAKSRYLVLFPVNAAIVGRRVGTERNLFVEA